MSFILDFRVQLLDKSLVVKVVIPEQLMNGGDHVDDHTRPQVHDTNTTCREHLLNQIVEGNFRRPM